MTLPWFIDYDIKDALRTKDPDKLADLLARVWAEVEDLHSDLDDLKDVEEAKKSLEAEVNDNGDTIDAHEARITELEKENHDLSGQICQLEDALDEAGMGLLVSANNNLKLDLEEAQRQNKHLQAEVDRLALLEKPKAPRKPRAKKQAVAA